MALDHAVVRKGHEHRPQPEDAARTVAPASSAERERDARREGRPRRGEAEPDKARGARGLSPRRRADAGGGTRTPTGFRPPGPKPGAYSNSATPARCSAPTAARGPARLYGPLRWPGGPQRRVCAFTTPTG